MVTVRQVAAAIVTVQAARLAIRHLRRAARNKERREVADICAKKGFTAIIVGAGFGGLCAAIKLQEAGIPFVIIEAAHDVGGTWLHNT